MLCMTFIFVLLSFLIQREVVSSTRLAPIPPAFSTRTLPAQATEYAFAFIQVPQDVSEQTSTHAEPEIRVAAESLKINFEISAPSVSFSASI